MNTTTTTNDLERFVRLGLAVSTDWQLELPAARADAGRVLDACGDYNDFDPAEVFLTISVYWGHVSAWTLAREGSIAVYAVLPYWRHQTLAHRADALPWPESTAQGTIISDTETREIARALMGDLINDKADEVSYVDSQGRSSHIYSARPITIEHERPYRIRAWWD